MGWLKPQKKAPQKKAEPAKQRQRVWVAPVSNHLSEKNILFFPAGTSLQEVLEKLVGSLNLANSGAALKAIQAREETGATVIGPGLAIPHARMTGLTNIAAAVGLCPTGVAHPSEGPLRLFVLFVSPQEKMHDHLAFLAGLSSVLQVEGLTDSLLQLSSAAEVLEKIRQAEKTL